MDLEQIILDDMRSGKLMVSPLMRLVFDLYNLRGIPFQLRVDFLNRLTILDLTLCKRIKSLDELPISLQAMDANITMSLERILTGSNWKLSKQLECFGSSKLQKNPTGNSRKKLIKVSLSFSLSLIELGFLDHNSILMT